MSKSNKPEGTSEKPQFEIGEVVQLKSGGPKMTVGQNPGAFSNPGVFCQWFAGSKLEHGFFAPATLIRPQPDKKEPPKSV